MIQLLALHAALAVVAPLVGARLGRRVFLLCALAPAATFAWVLSQSAAVADGGSVDVRADWVAELGLRVDLRLDGFALLLVGLISGVGVAVFLYSRWYFGDRAGLGRFAGVLTLFAGAMVGLVLADNLLLIYVFWELTSITSYLLIGFEDEKGSARAAALQALLITGAGGLAMLGGFVLVGQAAGTYSLSGILADPPASSGPVVAGLVLVLLGAFTKSAQVPFHSWLPGAMAAPTPVSAYLHSATMVKAGVYLIARFAPAFAPVWSLWRPVLLVVGITTMLVGGYRALRQQDAKLLLAFGTVSQLGFMVALFGAGIPDLTFAAAGVLLAHGLFKAALFLVVGIVDHQAHSRDIRLLSGIGRRMPLTFAVAAIAIVSMVGLPPLFGFIAKESALEALLHEGSPLAIAGITAGSVLTFAYGARFLWGTFATKSRPGSDDLIGADVAPPAPPLVAPAVVLTLATLAISALPSIADGIVADAATALRANTDVHLQLWHGVTTALVLSAATVAVGTVLFLQRARVERAQARLRVPVGAQEAYEAVVAGLLRSADRSTGFFQNGSLPVYIGVILTTAVVLPGWVLLTDTRLPSGLVTGESPMQVAVAALVIAAALATARSRHRFVAVLCLGGVGFGVAVLFVVQGAPDLALTQVLVETVAIVVFMLVLRHLPARFDTSGFRLSQAPRVVVAVAVGVFVTGFSLVAGGARSAPAVSGELVERALPEGGGRNVVNVILTDFRALDTLGEITVLCVAAFGIASLVLAGRDGSEER